DGTAGVAASSTAGAAAATPVLIAQMAPQFQPFAAQATALVATCVIVTSVVCPLVTAAWAKAVRK
ncbi:2-keto-3-deoxygluconate permease, partial [Herbiconiux daphne]